MTPERLREIERLYHAARARQPEERAAYLRGACSGDDSLRATVESLLARREDAAAFLEPPPGPEAARVATLGTSSDPSSHDAVPPGVQRPPPWWVWCCMFLAVIGAGGLYWVVLSGPAPVGWVLVPVRDDQSGLTRVSRIQPGSAAEMAGLQANDFLATVQVQHFTNRREPYAPQRLEVVRRGEPKALMLTPARKDLRYWFGRGRAGWRHLLMIGTSALYLALAGLLLVKKPNDRSARWGALLVMQLGFSTLYTALGSLRFSPGVAQAVRDLPLPVAVVSLLGVSISLMFPAGALGFSAVFPRPLPMSNRRWWLPFLALAPAVTFHIDLDWLWLPVYGSAAATPIPNASIVAAMLLALVSVAWALSLLAYNYRLLESRNERRRLRIVALGFGFSFLALAATLVLVTPGASIEEFRTRYWEGSLWQLLQTCFLAAAPVCTSYAILRHRVFDVHVMVRLGLRYAAARGVLLSIVPISGLVLALDVLTHRTQPVSDIVRQRGLLYVVLGVGALVLHVKRKAWTDALDKRFFRERYDAYHLLSGVADDVRRSASFDDAARHVIARIDGALHPESMSLMIRGAGEPAYHTAAAINNSLQLFPADAKVVVLARVLNKPLENRQSGTGWLREQLPHREAELLRRARVEWLFPILLGGNGPEAFLLLGPKRSEEPYSREDRMLLEAIAVSLGLLLERSAARSSSGFKECTECGTCYDSVSVRCDSDDGILVKSPYSRTLAGRYRLERRLGRGGMGTVYEAADILLERRVAVKLIRQEWIASAEALARFRREAKAAASFSHAHVVTVHDFGVAEDDRAYLVMELLEGHTLREELRERGSLEPERALKILRGVSSAVAKAHECRLLHRDLKPENVFLARSPDGEVAKVLDFGLVKPLESTHTGYLTGTTPGALIGTVAYMSPEQRAGGAPSGSWDIWALTVMAFEMLTGVHPFVESGDPRVVPGGRGNIASRVAARSLSAPAAAFFERALGIDLERRPASVHQLIEELGLAMPGSCS